MRAHQIMTRQVITATVDTPIAEAARTLLAHHISGMPVVDATGKLVGVVSQGDFMRRAEIGTQRKRSRWLKLLLGPGRAASDFVHERGRKVGEVMNDRPVTVSEDATLEEVTSTMEKNDIKRVPVMRGDRLVGIVTRTNLVQAVLDLAREVPDPTADDDHIRDRIHAAIEKHDWKPSGFAVVVRNGIVHLSRYHHRRAVAAGDHRRGGERGRCPQGARSFGLDRADVGGLSQFRRGRGGRQGKSGLAPPERA